MENTSANTPGNATTTTQENLEQRGARFRSDLSKAKRWVIKIGSALLTDNGAGLNEQVIITLVEDMLTLIAQGKEVVLVSSGSVAAGVSKLGMSERPKSIHELQAAAAVGQMSLIQCYEACFNKLSRHAAQILLTHDDLSNRTRYLNARAALNTLISLGVIPVINENDTVVTDEIRFGDNDNLAALVANLIDADVLVILTNQFGMYDSDPRDNNKARLLDNLLADDSRLHAMASGSKDGLGRGGMITKVQSASLAARSGTSTIIAHGSEERVLARLAEGEVLGSLLLASSNKESSRKQWLAGHLLMLGELVLDDGAVKALRDDGSSLLAVGVRTVNGGSGYHSSSAISSMESEAAQGGFSKMDLPKTDLPKTDFVRGDMVACLDSAGHVIARGLVNYSAEEIRKIAGLDSGSIEKVLGYINEPELINRDNMTLENNMTGENSSL